MHDRELTSLYARLQASNAEVADRALAWQLGHAVRDDAQHLADGLAATQRRRSRPALQFALAAAVALVAVFAGLQLTQDGLPSQAVPMHDSDMIADAPAPDAPLFSGSFEPGEHAGQGEGVIFDSSFGG